MLGRKIHEMSFVVVETKLTITRQDQHDVGNRAWSTTSKEYKHAIWYLPTYANNL